MSQHEPNQPDAPSDEATGHDQPSAVEVPNEASAAAAAPTTPPRRSRPIVGVTIIVLALLSVVVVRLFAHHLDFQVANLVTYAATITIFITGLIWYLQRGPGQFRRRATVALGILCLPIVFFSLVRIDGTTGELVPRLRFRWSPRPDEQLPQLEATVATDEGLTLEPMERDFPEFLGPQRRNRIDVSVAADWDAQPPQLLWRRRIGAGWSSFATRGNYAVTMEQRGPEELVTCYDITNGEPQWAHAIQARHATTLGGIGPRATPTWDEDRVYAQGATGVLRAIDGRTGKELWKVDILSEYGVTPEEDQAEVGWGRAGSPLIVDNLVVVPYGGPAHGRRYSLAAYDKMTGERVWRGGDRQVSFASPVLRELCGITQIVSVNEDNVSGHDPQTGEVLWEARWPGDSNANASATNPVVLPGDRVLLSKGYGGGAKLLHVTHDNGKWRVETLWKEPRLLKTKFTNVAIYGDYAFGLSDGILECIDWTAGESRWKSRKGRYRHGQVLGLRDQLLVQAEQGYMALVKASPDAFHEFARLPALDGQTWNNPCYAEPYLLVRNATEAACYKLTPAGATMTGASGAEPEPQDER